MRSASSKLRPTTPRFRRRARASLGLVGFAVLVAACSAAPTEEAQVGASPITGTPIPFSPSSGDGQITNGNGGCLDLPNGNTTNGTLLRIWACDSSGQNQTWYQDGDSIHYGSDPSKCVDFPAQALSNGVPVNQTQLQIWDCNGASGPDQVWHTTLAGNIQFAADTAKCVELRNGGYPLVNGSAQNGTPVQIYDCNGTSGQTWRLVQPGGGGATHSGGATWYNTGLGECGVPNDDSQHIAAIPDFDRSLCGRTATVCQNSTCVTVTIEDRCVACKEGDIELSPSAFQVLAPLAAGRIPVTWRMEF